MNQLHSVVLLLLILGCRSEISLDGTFICHIYQLSKFSDFNSIKGSQILTKEIDLCDSKLDFNVTSSVIMTNYRGCSPEIKSKGAKLLQAKALIVKSSSVVEDVLWNSRHNEFDVPTFLIVSGCDFNLSSPDLRFSADQNPFDTRYCIPLIIILELWNMFNLGYILRKLVIAKQVKISTICLLFELVLIPIRFFLFLEPLPYNILQTHLSYHVLVAINCSFSIGNMILICYSFWEVISNSKNGLQLIPEYGHCRYLVNRFKLVFLIFLILFIVDLVQSILRGLYLAIDIVEKVILIYYLLLITILAFVYIITYIEISKHNRGLTRYSIISGIGASLIVFGIVLFIVIPVSPIGIPFKVITLWSGFLLLSTGNISLVKRNQISNPSH